MELIAEVLTFFKERLRSPIITSIAFVFVMLNWAPLFNLLWGDTAVLDRLEYFGNRTNFFSRSVFPIVFGLMLAAIWPYIVFIGSKIVSGAVHQRKTFQLEEVHRVELIRLKHKSDIQLQIAKIARERKKLVDEVGENNVSEATPNLSALKTEGLEYLSGKFPQKRHAEIAIGILKFIDDEGPISSYDQSQFDSADVYDALNQEKAAKLKEYGVWEITHSGARVKSEFMDILFKLLEFGLVKREEERTAGPDYLVYTISALGYTVIDDLKRL